MEKEKIKEFEVFVSNLMKTYTTFHLNRRMHKVLSGKQYHSSKEMWNRVLVSLEAQYIVGLAILLDSSFLKNVKFNKKHQELQNKIIEWRNKFFCHTDSRKFYNFEEFLKNNIFNEKDVDSWFSKAIDIANAYNQNKNYNLDPDLVKYFERQKLNIEKKCDEWLLDRS